MTKKIYVGNLSFDATEAVVLEMFSQFGTVESIAMINDRETGRFRGFCFVEMPDDDADAAIAALDGQEVEGRNLKVNEALPKDARSVGRSGSRGGSSGGGDRW